jgi:hypothetical protein
MIKGKTPEEIRKLFNIVNDFTPEEEVSFPYFYFAITLVIHYQAQIKKENVSTTTLLPCITTSSYFFKLSRNGRRIVELDSVPLFVATF